MYVYWYQWRQNTPKPCHKFCLQVISKDINREIMNFLVQKHFSKHFTDKKQILSKFKIIVSITFIVCINIKFLPFYTNNKKVDKNEF